MTGILEAADFLRKLRRKMRLGALSRAPLSLVRLEVRRESAECDWLIRPPDPWDKCLPDHLREENQTLQALRDAMRMRELLFREFPGVKSAELRIFHEAGQNGFDLIMSGSVSRDDIPPRIGSIVMQAKLCGFQFSLSDGVLQTMRLSHFI